MTRFLIAVLFMSSYAVSAPAASGPEAAGPAAGSTGAVSATVVIEPKEPASGPSLEMVAVFEPPTELKLCGEPVPIHIQSVYEALDREFQINVYDRAQVIMWLKRANRMFPAIERALAQYGLPDDIKYLAVAESALRLYAYSPAGAAGVWQFMKATGRRYGLKKNRHEDLRYDFEAATGAALGYLKDLFNQFGSWSLALAAYNCGEDRVKREIQEQGVSNYYRLNLPRETERYVFRILAAKIILSNPKAYGYDPARIRLYDPIPTVTATISLRRPVHFRQIAEAAGTDFKEIRELNPSRRGYYLPAGAHSLRLPGGAPADFLARLDEILEKSPRTANDNSPGSYVVRSGDTLSEVALKLGLSLSYLRKRNNITSDIIVPGQVLHY
jgi:LysM repeat protein